MDHGTSGSALREYLLADTGLPDGLGAELRRRDPAARITELTADPEAGLLRSLAEPAGHLRVLVAGPRLPAFERLLDIAVGGEPLAIDGAAVLDAPPGVLSGLQPLLIAGLDEAAPGSRRTSEAVLAAALASPRSKTVTWNAPETALPGRLAADIAAYALELQHPYAELVTRPARGVRRDAVLSDGARLSYLEHGAGERVIITAQMGFPPEPNYPSLLAEAMPGTRVLEVTLRGFRPSDTVAADLGLGWLDRWADDIAELATVIGVERFSYTGGSHGGGVGWYLAARHPERLVSYIGVVSGPHDREGDTSSSGVRRSINDAWPDTQLIARLMEEGVFGPLSHDYRAGRRAALIRAAVDEYGEMLPEEARINQGKPWPDAVTDAQLAEELRRISVPTLLLSGAQDVIISARASMRAAANVPGAKMVLWQEEGHMTWEEEPRRLVAEVANYLDGLEG